MSQTTPINLQPAIDSQEDICNVIPHRPPFLFLEKVLCISDDKIETEYTVKEKDTQGHYPGNPLMPGVLLCELVFQAAAFFLGQSLSNSDGIQASKSPVLSKILDARFRQKVVPGDRLHVTALWQESSAGFHFFKGTIKHDSKTVMSVNCVLALV